MSSVANENANVPGPVLIWDLPTRLFHMLLASGFFAAAGIAFLIDEDSSAYPYHMLIGLTIALMVVLRLIWGVVGTRYARFGSFLFGPSEVFAYGRSVLTGGGKRYLGHNPGSALAIFAMLGLVLALAVTGFMMARGNEGIKDVHEILAYASLVVVGAHILGVLVHTVRHRENLTRSMITGSKIADAAAGIRSAQPVVAAVFLVVVGVWAFALLRGYDPVTRSGKLPLAGVAMQYGENEAGEAKGGGKVGEGAKGPSKAKADDDD